MLSVEAPPQWLECKNILPLSWLPDLDVVDALLVVDVDLVLTL
jgi:hypothetical protein